MQEKFQQQKKKNFENIIQSFFAFTLWLILLMQQWFALYNGIWNKRVCPTKNEPQQQGIYYLEREREGVR